MSTHTLQIDTFMNFVSVTGISHKTFPYPSQQNRVVEHTNSHLLEVARTLLIDINGTKHLWGDVVLKSRYFINHVPSTVFDCQIPYSFFILT